MRVAFVGPIHPWRGGIAAHAHGLIGALRTQGAEVSVVSFAELYPQFLFPGRSQVDPSNAPNHIRGLDAAQILSPIRPWTWSKAVTLLRGMQAQRLVFESWHPFFSPMLASIAASVRADGTRIVWILHNFEPHEGPGWLWRPLAGLGLRRPDQCITHSENVALAVRRSTECAVETVALPPVSLPRVTIDPHQLRRDLGFSEDAALFVFVGHVRRYKGVDILLEALTRLSLDGPPWQALIAGEWYLPRTSMERALQHPALEGKVRIRDEYLTDAELARVIEAATVVVAPYREGTQSGIVPLALAHGRPVVATSVGGIPEQFQAGRDGLLVPPGDAAALAQALEEIRRGRTFPEMGPGSSDASGWNELARRILA
jgi:glycosyltransferase involved in cell wall biosynthesis